MAEIVNLPELVREGEGQLVEFKESPSNLEKDIGAFANSRGGTIYIGISDNGEIRETQLTNRLKAQILVTVRNCDPTPEVELLQLDKLIALRICESQNKPVRSPTGFYLRMGAISQKLTRDEIISFAVRENKIRFDDQLYIDSTASEILDIRPVEIFRQRAGLQDHLDNLQLLENLGCLKVQNNCPYLTYAGVLIFGREPQRIFPQSTITLLQMDDPATIAEQVIVKGTLFAQVENSFSFLKTHLHTRPVIENLRREDQLEIPEFVLRELLVNTVVHRDYFESSADIVIKIFKNYIEFSNPGTVGQMIPLKSLYGKSFRRNPLIADLFFRANYIERAGTGLLRVQNALERMDLPLLRLSEEGPFFIATLPRPGGEVTARRLNERQYQLLSLPQSFFPFSTKEYAQHFRISERMARLDLNMLLKNKMVTSIRDGRKRHYGKSSD